MTIAGRSLKPRYSPSSTLIAAVALLLILFISSAFFFVLPEDGDSAEMIALGEQNESMRAEWLANKPEEFRYVVERHCYCIPAFTRPYAVEHRRGADEVAWFRPAGDETDLSAPPEAVLIEDLFVLVARASSEAASMEVSYNSRFAYPSRVVIDWSADVADDDQRFDVLDFEVLQYN